MGTDRPNDRSTSSPYFILNPSLEDFLLILGHNQQWINKACFPGENVMLILTPFLLLILLIFLLRLLLFLLLLLVERIPSHHNKSCLRTTDPHTLHLGGP